MLDLNTRGRDLRQFRDRDRDWVIGDPRRVQRGGERLAGRVGVWVVRPEKAPNPDGSPREDKIAAVGLKMRKWVSFHGLSINVEPELSHFDGNRALRDQGAWGPPASSIWTAGNDGRSGRCAEEDVRESVRGLEVEFCLRLFRGQVQVYRSIRLLKPESFAYWWTSSIIGINAVCTFGFCDSPQSACRI